MGLRTFPERLGREGADLLNRISGAVAPTLLAGVTASSLRSVIAVELRGVFNEDALGTSIAELSGRGVRELDEPVAVRLAVVLAIRSANSAEGSAAGDSSIARAERSGTITRGTDERDAGLRIEADFSNSRITSRPAVTAMSCGEGDCVSWRAKGVGRTLSAMVVSGTFSACGA